MKKQLLIFSLAMLAMWQNAFAYQFSYTYQGQTLYYSIVDGNAQVTYQNNYYPRYSSLNGSLVIPASVTYGGNTYAVTRIAASAFGYCSDLTSVTIPDAVTSIGEYAFRGCSGLTSVNYIGTVAQWCNIDFSNATSNPLYFSCSLNINGSPITNLVIPNGVTEIKKYAFCGCSSLTSVTIPDAVTSIGEYAFYYCSGLTSVTIPDAVTSIGESAFSGCYGLTSVTIPDAVTSIGQLAFEGCSGLTSVTIPDAVTSIGYAAFYGCSGLTSITIPDAVTSIGENAFGDCSGLTFVAFNADSCTEAGSSNYSAFYNCTNIANFTFGDNVKVIPDCLCNGLSGLTSVTIPNAVTSIGNNAFYNCSGLTSVTIGNAVTSIGRYAFYGCSGLTSVTIPDAVTFISDYSFSNCSGLTSVTIPDAVTSIGGSAFYNCSGLTEITSLPTVAPTLGNNAFGNVTSNIPVNIPCGSSMSYYSRWSYFSNFVEAAGFSFSAASANNAMGTVTILTQPTCQAPTAVFNAVANQGYHFDHWSDGNTDNPRSLTLTSDTALLAYFAANGGTEGINGISVDDVTVYTANGEIVVDGAEGLSISVFDMIGRRVGREPVVQVPNSGVYVVKIGSLPARKVVVVR